MKKLEGLRKQIDKTDRQLISLLAKRFRIAVQIGKLKSANKMKIQQSVRWNFVLTDRLQFGRSKGLSKNFVESLYRLIHRESKRLQK